MKKWLIIGSVIVVVAIIIGVLAGMGVFSGGGSSGTGSNTIGYIQIPDGPKVKVVFNGPPELKAEWEKFAWTSYQLQVIGTLTNVSGKSVKYSEIAFLLDGQQVAFNFGLTLNPGQSVNLAKGFPAVIPGQDDYAKVLEIRIEDFEVIGNSTSASPTESINPSYETADSPEEVVEKWYSFMSEGNFSEALKLYTPAIQQKILERGGAAFLLAIWSDRPVTAWRYEKTEKDDYDRAYVYGYFDWADGMTDDHVDFCFRKIDNEWKITEDSFYHYK